MKVFALLIATLLCNTVYALEASNPERSPRFVVHLLDYLAKDYPGAVSPQGKVLSNSEFSEQKEFAQQALKTNAELTETKSNPEIQKGLTELNSLIQGKSPPEAVTKLARSLQRLVIETSHLEVFPSRWPDLKMGQALFGQNCVSCHGQNGGGDGPAGKLLNPHPASFLDKGRMSEISPFAAFNSIRLGVSGTAMVGFQGLSDEEVWALAFYVSSLRFGQNALKQAGDLAKPEVLKATASLSDSALKETFSGTPEEKEKQLIAARTFLPSDDKRDYLAFAAATLGEARSDYVKGDFDNAKSKALKAYLEGIEPIEPKAKATDPEAVSDLEAKMAAVRGAIEGRKGLAALDIAIKAATTQIGEVGKLIEHQDMSPTVAFFAAFAILMREGFEAVLIILALLGVIRATGSKRAELWVHAGWILALSGGFIAWTFSGWLMGLSGAGREMLEGSTSLFAVFVLLYVGFWLHRQSEIGRWKEFLEVKVKSFLHGKNLLGLAMISFFAVFREAFETVLFLRAIWYDGGEATRTGFTMGVFGSLFLVIGLSWLALRWSKRLPLRQLFTVSSVLMLFLAAILTGKGFHSIQETGLLGVTSAPFNFRWELAGIYPTLETLVAQIVVCFAVFALWHYGRKPSIKLAGG